MHVPRETYEQAAQLLDGVVRASVVAFGRQSFSTRRLIESLRSTPEGQTAYEAVFALLEPQRGETMARQVIHGQIVPEILRGSGLVRFAGFIHGEPDEDDGYSVPSRWRAR